jgi:uncharacterized membrane protein
MIQAVNKGSEMRAKVKFRIIFLVLAIISVTLGVHWTPEALNTDHDKQVLFLIALIYFVLLPLAYWYCIIKIGEQKLWKMLVVFSLSSLVARLSFPADIAHYFEFIAWLRYPIIGVLLVIELYLIATIIRGLIKVRKVKGDPRVAAIEAYDHQDEKALAMAFLVASEPTNWYYAIPWFSRNHPTAITSINLLSAKPWHLSLTLSACLSACVTSYFLLLNWSELAAIIVASIISLSLVMLIANHRLSKYYSLYILRNKLVINNAIWGFMAIDITNIASLESGIKEKHLAENELIIGRGKHTNITMIFKQPQDYFGGLGQLTEKIHCVHLNLAEPEKLLKAIETQAADKAA